MAAKKKVPVYCYQCVAGPDLMKVEVEDGVAVRVESNYDIRGQHPGGGRVCVKAYGLIQKTYNPNRIKQPMKRTNPKKGRGEDPRFVPISWDEALDIVGAKLSDIRAPRLEGRVRLPARRGLDRRRRHAGAVYGHVPGVHGGVGPGRPGLWRGPGRQVLSLGASLRRALAPRLHRLARHALCELHHQLRQQCRGVGRRRRHLARGRCARARRQARPGRAASLDHRRALGRVGTDQAQDRRGVPVRAHPPHPDRAQLERSLRRRLSRGAQQLALSRRPERLVHARRRVAQAAHLGLGRRPRQAL